GNQRWAGWGGDKQPQTPLPPRPPYPTARQSFAPPRVSPPGALPQIMLVRLTSAVSSRGPAVDVKDVSSMGDKSTTLNEEDPFVDGGQPIVLPRARQFAGVGRQTSDLRLDDVCGTANCRWASPSC